jgi:hypothetical protein
MSNAGIDYGLGKTNIDVDTGIRFGIISANSLDSWIYEELELDYGKPTCPKCGSDVKDTDDITWPNKRLPEHKECVCTSCGEYYWSEECYPQEPISQYIDDGKYEATLTEINEMVIIKAPFYTLTKFCSPCFPGGGDLNNPVEEGVKTYCFGHEYFRDEVAPYPVYCAKTDKLIEKR